MAVLCAGRGVGAVAGGVVAVGLLRLLCLRRHGGHGHHAHGHGIAQQAAQGQQQDETEGQNAAHGGNDTGAGAEFPRLRQAAMYRPGRWFIASTRFSATAPATDQSTRSGSTVARASSTMQQSTAICTLPARQP